MKNLFSPLAKLRKSSVTAEIARLQEENEVLKKHIADLTARFIKQETVETIKEIASVDHEQEIYELKKRIKELDQNYIEELTKRLEISKEFQKIKNTIAIMEASKLLEY